MNKMEKNQNSLMVQWLGLRASTAEATGSIPGQGTKNRMPLSAAKIGRAHV